MKILHIITGLNRGGAETALYRFIAKSSVDAVLEHQVISLQGNGYYCKKLKELGVNVNTLNLNGLIYLPWAIIRLVQLVRRSDADIVQTWLYHSDLLGGIICRIFSRIPVVWGVHTVNLDQSTSSITKLIRILCAKLSNRIPKKIIFVSKKSADFHLQLGYSAAKIEVVPNGFESHTIEADATAAMALRHVLGIENDEIVIGCVGRFHPDKDYLNLIKAIKILKDRNINSKVLLIGPDLVPTNPILTGWIMEHGLMDNFIALGQRDDIGICLKSMNIFCLPSRTEAFPLVLGEAMAAGRPIVATNVGDVEYIVGDTGFVVAHSNPDILAQGLEKMIHLSVEDRNTLGDSAKLRILDKFSMDTTVSKTCSIYKKIVYSR